MVTIPGRIKLFILRYFMFLQNSPQKTKLFPFTILKLNFGWLPAKNSDAPFLQIVVVFGEVCDWLPSILGHLQPGQVVIWTSPSYLPKIFVCLCALLTDVLFLLLCLCLPLKHFVVLCGRWNGGTFCTFQRNIIPLVYDFSTFIQCGWWVFWILFQSLPRCQLLVWRGVLYLPHLLAAVLPSPFIAPVAAPTPSQLPVHTLVWCPLYHIKPSCPILAGFPGELSAGDGFVSSRLILFI